MRTAKLQTANLCAPLNHVAVPGGSQTSHHPPGERQTPKHAPQNTQDYEVGYEQKQTSENSPPPLVLRASMVFVSVGMAVAVDDVRRFVAARCNKFVNSVKKGPSWMDNKAARSFGESCRNQSFIVMVLFSPVRFVIPVA